MAACELIALANGQGTAPTQVSSLLSELAPNAGLLQLAIRALPRVLDPKHSEWADLRREDLEAFDALYERLVAARGRFEKHPAAVLSLTLNGHGAFDDTSVLSQLPHLRRTVTCRLTRWGCWRSTGTSTVRS